MKSNSVSRNILTWKLHSLWVEGDRRNSLKKQDKNGQRYPKFRKMLWRDEGLVSTQYLKARLQLEDLEIKKIREPLKPLGTQEKGIFIKH